MAPIEPLMRLHAGFATVLLAVAVSLGGCAATGEARQPASGSFEVVRADGGSVTLSAAVLQALPRETLTAAERDRSVRYSGIELRHVLRAAGIEAPHGLRGALLRRVLLVGASDGYAAVFAFGELDPTIGGKRVFLVDREDGVPLAPAVGPWRLVVPGEGRPTRWVRQVTRLAAIDVR